ncbi:hypothetical protein Droror1_Dr00017488, partial [Drosera rotundifolia]
MRGVEWRPARSLVFELIGTTLGSGVVARIDWGFDVVWRGCGGDARVVDSGVWNGVVWWIGVESYWLRW